MCACKFMSYESQLHWNNFVIERKTRNIKWVWKASFYSTLFYVISWLSKSNAASSTPKTRRLHLHTYRWFWWTMYWELEKVYNNIGQFLVFLVYNSPITCLNCVNMSIYNDCIHISFVFFFNLSLKLFLVLFCCWFFVFLFISCVYVSLVLYIYLLLNKSKL